jgi:hypothetical protein
MFLRCDTGSVNDLLLRALESHSRNGRVYNLLDQIEDGYSIAYGRQKVGAIRSEAKVSTGVNRS